MANPFPGMDPYLEGPLWPSAHHELLSEFVRQLAPQIMPKYVALPVHRVVIAPPDPVELGGQNRWPDVGVVPAGPGSVPRSAAATSAPLVVEDMLPESITVRSLEVRDVDRRRLVTAIELLSPTNKRGDGAAEYADKRAEVCRSPAHLLEIDLLRVGERFPVRSVLPSVPNFVFLSRADRRPALEVWPITYDQPLPRIAVPLAGTDPDATLDLQAALATVHQVLGCELLTDYRQPPAVPFAPEQEAWADGVLRAAGKRP